MTIEGDTFEARGIQFTDVLAQEVAENIRTAQHRHGLENFIFSNNRFMDDSFRIILNAMRKDPSDLKLSNNSLTHTQLAQLGHYINSTSSIGTFSLEGDNIGANFGLIRGIGTKHINTIILDSAVDKNAFGDFAVSFAAVEAAAPAARQVNPNERGAVLTVYKANDAIISALATIVGSNTPLKLLSIRGEREEAAAAEAATLVKLADDQVIALADALQFNRTITSVDIGGCILSRNAFEALRNAVLVNTSITNLQLFTTDISFDDGALRRAEEFVQSRGVDSKNANRVGKNMLAIQGQFRVSQNEALEMARMQEEMEGQVAVNASQAEIEGARASMARAQTHTDPSVRASRIAEAEATIAKKQELAQRRLDKEKAARAAEARAQEAKQARAAELSKRYAEINKLAQEEELRRQQQTEEAKLAALKEEQAAIARRDAEEKVARELAARKAAEEKLNKLKAQMQDKLEEMKPAKAHLDECLKDHSKLVDNSKATRAELEILSKKLEKASKPDANVQRKQDIEAKLAQCTKDQKTIEARLEQLAKDDVQLRQDMAIHERISTVQLDAMEKAIKAAKGSAKVQTKKFHNAEFVTTQEEIAKIIKQLQVNKGETEHQTKLLEGAIDLGKALNSLLTALEAAIAQDLAMTRPLEQKISDLQEKAAANEKALVVKAAQLQDCKNSIVKLYHEFIECEGILAASSDIPDAKAEADQMHAAVTQVIGDAEQCMDLS